MAKGIIAGILLSATLGAVGTTSLAVNNEDFRNFTKINQDELAIIQEQEQTIKNQEQTIKDTREEMQAIELARQTLLTEKTTLQNKVTTLTNSKTELESQIETLTTEKTTLENTLTSVNSELNTTKTKLANKETELTNTQNRLDTVSATLTEKENLLAQSQTELENSIANGELKDEEIAKQKLEITNLQSDINVLNSEKTTLQNKVTTLTNEKQVLITERDNLQSQVTNLTNAKIQLENDLATKTAELEQANARIAELENSSGEYEVVNNTYDCIIIESGAGHRFVVPIEDNKLHSYNCDYITGFGDDYYNVRAYYGKIESYDIYLNNSVVGNFNKETITYDCGVVLEYPGEENTILKFVDEKGESIHPGCSYDGTCGETHYMYVKDIQYTINEETDEMQITDLTICLYHPIISNGDTDLDIPWWDEE